MSTTSVQKAFADCPACKKPIIATIQLDLETGEWDGETLPVTTTIAGARIQHNCIPRIMR